VQLQKYLDRISFGGKPAPTLDTLNQLLAHHARCVPFENLDVQLGLPLTTSPAEAFNKIVSNNRGGWCYEQNGLFGWALAEIGYEVTRIAAAVMRAERGNTAIANHLCLLVRPVDDDRTFLADVGFGGSMYKPIALEASEHVQVPFGMGLRRTDDGFWQFWEDIGKGEFSFDFEEREADEDALHAKCKFLQEDPSSSFVQNLVAQIRLPDAHKSLRGKVLSHVTSNGIETYHVESADQLLSILEEVFDLDVPEIADAWPRIEARHEELFGDKN